MNRHGEVYIIYTREDLAREMQVSYRKAISCFKELADRKLVWEQRQGRGLPNRIFLAEVELDEKSCYTYDCAPFSRSPDLQKLHFWMRMTMQPRRRIAAKRRTAFRNQAGRCFKYPIKNCGKCTSRHAGTACLELPKTALLRVQERHIKTCQNRTQVRKIRVRKSMKIRMIRIRLSRARTTGAEAIAAILQHCQLSRYEPEEAAVFRDAVCWLYYCGRLQLGACTYPQGYVRETLCRLNAGRA